MREIVENAEAFEGFDYKFTVIIYRENNELYYTHQKNRFFNINQIQGQKIPKENIYPCIRESITIYPHGYENIYIKYPNLLDYEPSNKKIKSNTSKEIEILEYIKLHPHPNICEYLGCISDGKYITGICFKKYNITLKKAVESKVKIDKRKIINQIKSGLNHIHSLDLIHDDIKPNNIMLDNQMNAVIIDFDSCKKEGHKRNGKSGTIGWSNESDIVSKENDIYSFKLIIKYIQCANSEQEHELTDQNTLINNQTVKEVIVDIQETTTQIIQKKKNL